MFKVVKNSFILFLSVAVLLTASLTPAPTASAAVPQYLGYEGYLTTVADDAVTDTLNMTFRIYDALAAGSLLWTEAHPAVSITDGYFSVQLGSVTALNLDFEIPYWISFQVSADPEMTPRQPINSVGYSYFSDNTYAVTDADLDTTIDATTDDQIDIAIAGADDFQFVANILKILVGSSIEVDTISETTVGAGVTIDSITLIDGGATVFTGGTNTFNITNGTSSLDVASGSALDVNANLTVESASFVNQDLTTDASVTFTGLSNTNANITAVGDIALDSISSAASHISIAATNATDMLQIGDGTYSWGHSPMVGIEGILEVDGIAYFDAGFSSAGDLDMAGNDILNVDQITGNSTYITIGDVGAATTHTLNTNDDLLVGGRLEVDGTTFFDGSLVMGGAQYIYSSTTKGVILLADTYQGPDAMTFFTGSDSNNLLVAEFGDVGYDFAHAQQTNPTLFIQSTNQTADEWISFSHNQTDGVIDVGTGAVNFLDNVQVGDGTFAWGHTPQVGIEGILEVDGAAYFDASATFAAGVTYRDNAQLKFGDGDDAIMNWETADADAHYLNLILAQASRNFIISEDVNIDWGHAASTDPTLFIHSSDGTDTTDWISLTHNQTDGVIDVGTGAVNFLDNVQVGDGTFAWGHAPQVGIEGALEVDGLAYFDGSAVISHGTKMWLGGTTSNDAYFKPMSLAQNQLLLALGANVGRQLVLTNGVSTDRDHDLAVQTDPTLVVYSALDPDTDNGEYLGLSYLGLTAGTLETDRPKFDMTFTSVSPFATAGGTNRDGADIIFDASSPTNSGTIYGITSVGANTNSHNIDTAKDSLFVDGQLEVDGTAYFDGITYFDSVVQLNDDKVLQLGSSSDAKFTWETADADAHYLNLALTGVSRNFIISEDVDIDWGHVASTDPTLFVQSSDSTTVADWISLSHDQTDGRISVGTGQLILDAPGGVALQDGGVTALSITNDGTMTTLLPPSGDYLRIGDAVAGHDKLVTPTDDDLFITGKLEVDGIAYFDSSVYLAESVVIGGGKQISSNASLYGSLLLDSTLQTNRTMAFLTGSTANSILINEYDDRDFNFAHTQQTNPTIFIHSANQSTDEWLSFTHNGTNGVIDVGTGAIVFNDQVAFTSSSTVYYDDVQARFGNGSDVRLGWETADADAHYLNLALTGVSRNFVISEDVDIDWGHAASTDPTMFIQSADATSLSEWLSFSYSSFNDRAEIEAGAGNIHFNSSIETGAYEFSEDAGFVSAMDMSVSATPAAGTQQSYTFKIDGQSFLKMYAEADSSGGIQNEEIRFYETLAGEWFTDETSSLVSVKQTPSTSTVNTIMILHADGTNWAANSHVLEIITDDDDALPFAINNGSSDIVTFSRSGSLNLAGNIYLTSGGSINTSANGDLTLIPNGTGITVVGDAGAQNKMGTPLNDDLFVSGRLEVDGKVYMDNTTNFYNTVTVADDVSLGFGISQDAIFQYDLMHGPDTLFLGLSADSRGFIISEKADLNIDFGHALQDNPTVFIHSADATSVDQWLSLAHDQTNAVIESGAGNIHFNSSIETGAYEYTEDGGFLSAMDMSVSATPVAGTQESYAFKIDGQSFIKIYSEADSAGSIQNESIKFYKPIAYLPSADQSVADDAAVTCTDTITRVVGADVDAVLDTEPAINDGTEDGQYCILQGTADGNLVTVHDAVNTQLNGGGAFSLGIGDTLVVIWDAGESLWIEVSRSDN